jgi:hypothetical protein
MGPNWDRATCVNSNCSLKKGTFATKSGGKFQSLLLRVIDPALPAALAVVEGCLRQLPSSQRCTPRTGIGSAFAAISSFLYADAAMASTKVDPVGPATSRLARCTISHPSRVAGVPFDFGFFVFATLFRLADRWHFFHQKKFDRPQSFAAARSHYFEGFVKPKHCLEQKAFRARLPIASIRKNVR